MRFSCSLACAAVLANAAALSVSPAGATDVGVDVALVIAGDVSGSMGADELRLQRDGFAAAFRHPDVLKVIGSGMTGRVAVTYVEWAGPEEHWIIAPWTVIGDRADAIAFAALLSAAAPVSGRHTSLSNGLVFAAAQFRSLDTTAVRHTIDISGDGLNSAGMPLAQARQFVLDLGITINGLTFPEASEGYPDYAAYMASSSTVGLARYYADCVVGGAGSFAMSVEEPAQFLTVIRRKVALEIAALPDQFVYANFASGSGDARDCTSFDAK